MGDSELEFIGPLCCRHCGNETRQKVVATHSQVASYEDPRSGSFWDAGPIWKLIICPACSSVSLLRIDFHDGFGPEEWPISVMFPRPEDAPSGLPVELSRVYQAAQQVINAEYFWLQITRMESAIIDDPSLAIGTAKELVETCCKTILQQRGINVKSSPDLPILSKQTIRELKLAPTDIPDDIKAEEIIRRLLNNLGSICQSLTELRNAYGTGHGRDAFTRGLGPRHARLVVGAASTLAAFLLETHNEIPKHDAI